MKKLILTISIVAALGINVNAQYQTNNTDGFFTTNANNQYRNVEEVLPGMPMTGVYGDQNAPIGSGLLLLAGMGLAYGLRKSKRQ